MAKDKSWVVKWEFLITRLKELIAQKGQEIIVVNIDAMMDAEEQYKKYMKMVEMMKTQFNAVVTTGLPGEERIFWPYHDVQFYIREDEEKIQSTGNYEVIQKVINTK